MSKEFEKSLNEFNGVASMFKLNDDQQYILMAPDNDALVRVVQELIELNPETEKFHRVKLMRDES